MPSPHQVLNFPRDIEDMFKKQNDMFDSWYSDDFGRGSIEDISKREDDLYIYYEIKVEDLNLTSLNTKIENGHNGNHSRKR